MRTVIYIALLFVFTPALGAVAAEKISPAANPDVQVKVMGTRPNVGGYPAASRDAGEEGDVVVSVLVDEKGVVRDARVKTSSGHARLDGAALELFKSGTVYTPAMKNGRPVASWVDEKTSYHLTQARTIFAAPTVCFDEPLTGVAVRDAKTPPFRQMLIDNGGNILAVLAWDQGQWKAFSTEMVMAVASQARFQPVIRDGKPIRCWFDVAPDAQSAPPR